MPGIDALINGDRGETQRPLRSQIIWHVVLFVSMAGIAAALTLLFRSMRSVMAVGGFCASGGPYQITTPCPKGTALLMNAAIWGGLIMTAFLVAATIRVKAPGVVWLIWPALFLSLGWNFLEFSIDPPVGDGIEWGWMVCAVVFFIMGAGPLLVALPLMRTARKHADKKKRRPSLSEKVLRASTTVRDMTTPPNVKVTPIVVDPIVVRSSDESSPPVDDGNPLSGPMLVEVLERLSALHRQGQLTDAQYEAAKRALIGAAG